MKKINDSGESSAEEKARLRKCMGVHEGTENQNKTLLTRPTSLEMLKNSVFQKRAGNWEIENV